MLSTLPYAADVSSSAIFTKTCNAQIVQKLAKYRQLSQTHCTTNTKQLQTPTHDTIRLKALSAIKTNHEITPT
jgi:hypothetical protein